MSDRPEVVTVALALTDPHGETPAPSAVPESWRVVDVRPELPTTVTLHVTPVVGAAPRWLPAQFSMIGVFGVGEVPISISSDPSDASSHAYTVRAAGPVTSALCHCGQGDLVTVRGPFGNSWDVETADASDVVVVAGGIGLAPLRSAVRAILARRDRYGRIAVVVGCRSGDDLLFPDDLAAWGSRRDVEIHLTADRGRPGWPGRVGLVTCALPDVELDWPSATAFVCGPDAMMGTTATALVGLGMDPARVRLTLERNMRCGVGLCGHCQLGPVFVCRDGPVFTWDRLRPFFGVAEV